MQIDTHVLYKLEETFFLFFFLDLLQHEYKVIEALKNQPEQEPAGCSKEEKITTLEQFIGLSLLFKSSFHM